MAIAPFNANTRVVEPRTGQLTREGAQLIQGLREGVEGGSFQPVDATLTALAALNTTAGLVVQTDVDEFTKRSLVAPSAGITISNPAGTSGDPTFALANDLSALEGLGSAGMAVRTGTDAWNVRTLTGTANQIDVTNGDGVSGNPTLALPADVTITGTMTFEAVALATGTKTATATAGAATLDKSSGKITSEALTTAAAGTYTLTLTNSTIAAADVVLASVANGTNTAGTTNLVSVTPGAGSAVIIIRNDHSADAFNGTLVISFAVIK